MQSICNVAVQDRLAAPSYTILFYTIISVVRQEYVQQCYREQ